MDTCRRFSLLVRTQNLFGAAVPAMRRNYRRDDWGGGEIAGGRHAEFRLVVRCGEERNSAGARAAAATPVARDS